MFLALENPPRDALSTCVNYKGSVLLRFIVTVVCGQTGMSAAAIMRMCFSGCGGGVYISSTLAGGSQIQGQPGLHSKTLYLFLRTFTKQNTCVADLWNCLGSTEIGKQMVLKVFSI